MSWHNWSGSVAFAPSRQAQARDVADVERLVREAAQRGDGVRVVGSGHAHTPLCETTGLLLSLDKLHGLAGIHAAAHEATAFAGTRMQDLSRALADYQIAFPNLGAIDSQTLGGAISTGTHGTGADLGVLSTLIAGLSLVDGAGDTLEISDRQNPELLPAAALSLGALGVVTQVRLKLVPAFRLRLERRNFGLEECLRQSQALAERHRHFELFYFPHSERVAARIADRTDLPPRRQRVRRFVSDVVLENAAFFALSEVCRALPGLTGPISQASARLFQEGTSVAESHQLLSTPRNVRFHEMEYFVPRAHGPDCLREIAALIRNKHLAVHFPIEYRFVKGDDLWLSPAYQRDSVSIALHQYLGLPHQDYFRGAEAIFRNYGGRPHWRKLHTASAAELAQLYPRFEDFRAVRKRLDPDGRFASSYVDRLLGPIH